MFRKITDEDRDEYLVLAAEFYGSPAVLHPVPAENFVKAFEEMLKGTLAEGCLFVENGRAAGYALLSRAYSQEAGGVVLWLEEIYVRPEYRGSGIAGGFIDWLVQNRAPEVRRIRLEAERDNKGAIGLYEKKGFGPLPYIQMTIDF